MQAPFLCVLSQQINEVTMKVNSKPAWGLFAFPGGCVSLDGWSIFHKDAFQSISACVQKLEVQPPCPLSPLSPAPGAPPFAWSRLFQHTSFSFLKKSACKNKQTPKNQAEKPTCYEAVSSHRDTSKTNAARRPQTSFVPSHRLTMITQLGFFFFFPF